MSESSKSTRRCGGRTFWALIIALGVALALPCPALAQSDEAGAATGNDADAGNPNEGAPRDEAATSERDADESASDEEDDAAAADDASGDPESDEANAGDEDDGIPSQPSDEEEKAPVIDFPGGEHSEAAGPERAPEITFPGGVEAIADAHVGERDVVGRLTLRAHGHFAGTFESNARSIAIDGSERVADPTKEPIEPSFGGAIQFEVPLSATQNILALGVMVGAMSWTTEVAQDLDLGRHTWIDLDVTVRGQYELVDGFLELYLLVPIGLTIDRFSERTIDINEIAWGHGPGFNVSTILGTAFDLGGHGLFVELGWTHRQFFHDAAGETFGTPVEFELDGVTNQLHIGTGFFFDI